MPIMANFGLKKLGKTERLAQKKDLRRFLGRLAANADYAYFGF